MTLPAGLRQHLIDPEMCARCGSCEEVCSRHAIMHDHRNFVVDVERCDQRMDCLKACATGAIDHWRIVRQAEAYSVATQMEWLELPAPQPLPSGAEVEAVLDALSQAGRRTHAPPSAPRPSTNLYARENVCPAKVVENRALTQPHDGAEVRHLVLSFEQRPMPLLEGQSVGVLPPGLDAQGRPHHVRLYSVASARNGERPGTTTAAFSVKRVLADHEGRPSLGVCSNYLCDLEPGSIVMTTGPVGDTFLMPDEAGAPLLMVCTGTGIAPMRGMIQRRERLAREAGGPMVLFYGGCTPGELPYLEELAALPPGFVDVHLAYSRVAGEPKTYVQDALRDQREPIARLILKHRCYVYVCGLHGMERGVHDAFTDILRAVGADWGQLLPQLTAEGRYHVEVY